MARGEAIAQGEANDTGRGKWYGARQMARGEAVTLFQGIRPLEGHRAVL